MLKSPSAFIAKPIVFPGAFSKNECDRVSSLAAKVGITAARLDGAWDDYRVGQVAWLEKEDSETKWVVQKIAGMVEEANREFRFNLSSICHRLQITQYDESGKFEWHHDCDPDDIVTRKLTVMVQLSERSDYDGGEFEIFPYGVPAFSKARGSATIFPAFLFHRVTELQRGKRQALISWADGPPFE